MASAPGTTPVFLSSYQRPQTAWCGAASSKSEGIPPLAVLIIQNTFFVSRPGRQREKWNRPCPAHPYLDHPASGSYNHRNHKPNTIQPEPSLQARIFIIFPGIVKAFNKNGQKYCQTPWFLFPSDTIPLRIYLIKRTFCVYSNRVNYGRKMGKTEYGGILPFPPTGSLTE